MACMQAKRRKMRSSFSAWAISTKLFMKTPIFLSKELDLTLTKRQDIPMSGVPFHTCEIYIDKLVAKGFRVAIAEQMEDPKKDKGFGQTGNRPDGHSWNPHQFQFAI